MSDLKTAIELVRIGRDYRNAPGSGGIWIGRNNNLPDAQFNDWGLARATAEILNAVIDGRLVISEPASLSGGQQK